MTRSSPCSWAGRCATGLAFPIAAGSDAPAELQTSAVWPDTNREGFMAAKVIKIQEWLDCFKEATDELAKSSLRFDATQQREAPVKGEQANPGTYIAIMTDSNSMHLGITSTPQGVRTLARGLLGLRQDQELSDQEAVDGVSEVMNIVAGKVKS